MPASYRFKVTGQVQGVFFRQSTVEQARALALAGWVRNCADGAVEGVAAGTPEALARLKDWLRRGPPAARVDALEWSENPAEEPLAGFVIRR